MYEHSTNHKCKGDRVCGMPAKFINLTSEGSSIVEEKNTVLIGVKEFFLISRSDLR